MRQLVAACAAAWAAACSSAPPPVQLSSEWPDRAGDYRDVTEAWTRHGNDRATGDDHITQLLIDVHATFKSPEWHAAHIAFLQKQHRLPPAEVAALTEKRRAELTGHYEVALMVATYDRRQNDLQKGARSTWRVALVDESGVEILADQILRDRRNRRVVAAEFPHIGDFHQAYIARFPRTIDLLRP
jgi:hypothetical protein